MMKMKQHQLVSIEDYEHAAGLYTKVFCDNHPDKELTEACQYCHKVFCVSDRDAMMAQCQKAKGLLRQSRSRIPW